MPLNTHTHIHYQHMCSLPLSPPPQAMIHELVGIKDNTAVLTSPKVAEQYRWVAVTECDGGYVHVYGKRQSVQTLTTC